MPFAPFHPQRALPQSRISRPGISATGPSNTRSNSGCPAQHVPGENLVYQVAVNLLILDRHLAGHQHAHDRLAAAPARAAGLVQQDVGAARGGQVPAELFEHLLRAGGVFARGRAHLNTNPIARLLLAQGLLRLGGQKSQTVWRLGFASAARGQGTGDRGIGDRG